MRSIRTTLSVLQVALFVLATNARAEVTLPKVLGDNMVLQRGQAIPIWGKAAPEEQVTVRFGAQQKTAKANPTGDWRVALDPLKESDQPADLTIAGSNTLTLKNILVGEVWLCGGQSNMEFPMSGANGMRQLPPMAEALAKADEPMIRLFRVEKNERAFTVKEGWTPCTTTTAGPFSAVGYFYGKQLHDALHVPIGLIESCWGGSHIERWTPAEAYEKSPLFASAATSKPVKIDNQRAGQYFEPMIRPLAPFGIRGAIWYQGESNIINSNDRMHYFDKFKVMTEAWRALWGQGDFPFYTVEIAPYYYTKRKDPLPHSEEELPYLWEAQVACLKLPNVGMAATTDLVTDFGNIHPENKWEVGRRLALIAMVQTYQFTDRGYAGPMFHSAAFKDGKAIINFKYTGSAVPQLATSDGQPPNEFTIAGVDGKFVPATAVITPADPKTDPLAALKIDTVIVSSPDVKDPKAVRFGWHETAQPNLIDKSSKLPAIPFRTDPEAK